MKPTTNKDEGLKVVKVGDETENKPVISFIRLDSTKLTDRETTIDMPTPTDSEVVSA